MSGCRPPLDEPPIDAGTAGASARRQYERRRANRETRVKELATSLAGVEGIRVLHDRRVPGTRGNIDHIVVAPAGVFVVDAKRHKGLIRIRDVGWLFRRDERISVGSRDCSKLPRT